MLWVSIISILISCISLCVTLYFNKKQNDINLESKFFWHIYKDYLIDKIPKARFRISYNSEEKKVLGTKDMSKVLYEMRYNSAFYKFSDKAYYQDLAKRLSNLENKYVEADKMDPERFDRFLETTNKEIEEIYKIILKKYKNGKE